MMNKRELAEMDALRKELGKAQALHFPDYPKPEPRDVWKALDVLKCELLVGWFQNNYGLEFRVTKGCSSRVNHSQDNPNRTSTQGCGQQFTTRLEALQVVRHEMTHRFAEALAKVDAEIAKETAFCTTA